MKPSLFLKVASTAFLLLIGCGGTQSLTVTARLHGTSGSAFITNLAALVLYVNGARYGIDSAETPVKMMVGDTLELRAEGIDSLGRIIPVHPNWLAEPMNALRISRLTESSASVVAMREMKRSHIDVVQGGRSFRLFVTIGRRR